ncbi:hypothetical protein SS50377_26712 [Spironucleus salmonicida]|uniref:Uncharacterized protein n=1 Tax=Spironucleus salmonicida TaxID=348837 RepID=V6M6Z8_9EUKA|nr:hypothetical protein SS50377_26712 [Spironucleus salmonicida]|eukprot:EST49184.1 hypothetical protein SS50377_10399 [Spironucleus salmonicida]
MTQNILFQPKGYRINLSDLDLYIFAHELYTGCKLGIKRSKTYNVNHYVETFACKNFISCPFDLKIYVFQNDDHSAFFRIIKPHLHDITENTDKPFYSVQKFIRANHNQDRQSMLVGLQDFINKASSIKDVIGQRHRFEFKALPLGRTTAYVMEDLLPSNINFQKKQTYYRRQEKDLLGKEKEALEQENNAVIEQLKQLLE